MKKISLDKGKFAIVDDDDFEFLSQWNWYVSDHGYAVTTVSPHKYMHRMVIKTPKGKLTDHINRNTLDNRKKNLRITDKRGNSINRDLQSNNTSGHKGVSWSKVMNKWEAYIWQYGKKTTLGYFESIQYAADIRKIAEMMYYEI